MSMAGVAEQDPIGTQVTSDDVAYIWRRDQFLEMGFDENESAALANAKETSVTGGKDKNTRKLTWEAPLHHDRVKKVLDAGATHAQVLGIFI